VRLAVCGSEGFTEILTTAMDTFRFIPAAQGRASHLSRIPDPEEIKMPEINTTTAELAAFGRSILSGTPYPVPLDDVMHGACVFDAAVESARTKMPVAVKP
jgi:predicted dehydrogenase